MKKYLRLILLIFLCYVPSVLAVDNICATSGALRALKIASKVMDVLAILAPSILLLVSGKALVDVVLNDKDNLKEEVGKFIYKFIIAAFIFMLPNVLYNIFDSFSFNNTFTTMASCNECFFSKDKCDGLITTAANAEKAMAAAKQKERDEAIKKAKEEAQKRNSSPGNLNSGGSFLGQKYNLTENELLHIAAQCAAEQGDSVGAAAEASLMANRFELFNKKYDNIHDYVKNSGWWAHSKTRMVGSPKVDASVVEAVRSVLVYGNRTLPLYIDEHDCFSDLTSCTNNGTAINIKTRSMYEQDVTIIKNRYGATYTFYTFPTGHADPFGYTSSALNKYNQMKGN